MSEKLYWNGEKWFPERIDFPDGSYIIIYENGSILTEEAQSWYNGKNRQLYFWGKDYPFALN
jgi:hypothetical protein